ncbi:MAG: Sec-independent protein translocase protein TatC [Patescibacteria group bacterium]|nr:Sec-independent protein translocase protein TatC [Patescibacteria group bacterium]
MAGGFKGFIDTYGQYLNDLWRRLYWITICFIVAFAAGFFFAGKLVQLLISSFHLKDVTIVVTSPFQANSKCTSTRKANSKAERDSSRGKHNAALFAAHRGS